MRRLSVVALAMCVLLSIGADCDAPITDPGVTGEIIIRYSATTASQIGFFTAAAGRVYLILDLEIENRGYESFDTNPFYFHVVVDRIKYMHAFVTIENELQMVEILDGGKTSGKIVFEVPEDVMSLGYELRYEGWWDYNVSWISQ